MTMELSTSIGIDSRTSRSKVYCFYSLFLITIMVFFFYVISSIFLDVEKPRVDIMHPTRSKAKEWSNPIFPVLTTYNRWN